MQPIGGVVRRNIVHALTYHELPPEIDARIDKLPDEAQLLELRLIQRDYLSFTVYSLKQMVASGTISAETAWNLFDHEWEKAPLVVEGNFKLARAHFFKEAGKSPGNKKSSLLEFEFYARAGKAGLDQSERFQPWATQLDFFEPAADGKSRGRFKVELFEEPVKEEYRKAIWLEMRGIEQAVGIRRLNFDVSTFGYHPYHGSYNYQYNKVVCAIDLYTDQEMQLGHSIDAYIRAQIGHWMFGAFMLQAVGADPGAARTYMFELMHSMHSSAFTPRIGQALDAPDGAEIPPEAKTFREGFHTQFAGLFDFPVIREGDYYPIFPMRYDGMTTKEWMSLMDDGIHSYVEAEKLEVQIRNRVLSGFKQGRIGPSEVYTVYRRMGVYLALAHMAGEKPEQIAERVNRLDVREMDDYFFSYRARALAVLGPIIKGGPEVSLAPLEMGLDVAKAIDAIQGSRLIDRRRVVAGPA